MNTILVLKKNLGTKLLYQSRFMYEVYHAGQRAEAASIAIHYLSLLVIVGTPFPQPQGDCRE